MKKTAVYPGSFDPPTLGHLDLIKRASNIFENVIVAVLENPNKEPTFSTKERIKMLKKITANLKNVTVDSFKGLLVDYMNKKGAKIIIRGLRAISDFEYEFQMSLMNRKLCPKVETVYLIPNERYIYVSSSLVKEIVRLNGNISCLVPEEILGFVEEKIRRKK